MDRVEPVPALHASNLEKALSGNLIGRQVVVLAQATSSNDVALQMAQAGTNEGLVVFAEEQTAGRGQRGNRWESAPGRGLWFSILLQPDLTPADSHRLTTWAAQSVAHTIQRHLHLPTVVKSPNDIYVTGHKVAGVLVEMRARVGAPHLAIIGIGINVSQTAADFPDTLQATAISLAVAAGRPVDRPLLAVALLRDLDESYGAAFAP